MTDPLSPTLHGRWQMVRAELAGEAAPEWVAQKSQLHLSATGYAVHFDGAVVDRGIVQIATAGDHRSFVLRSEFGPKAGRALPCLFQLVGDRLRICYGLDDAQPTEFTTRDGQQRYLATYRRDNERDGGSVPPQFNE